MQEVINYKIEDISVSDIIFPKEELRTNLVFEELDELARSIRSVGLMNPLTVRQVGDKYELIAGYRRLKACEIVNLPTVPCRVVNSDDNTADLQRLHENMFREEVNPVDEAHFFKRLLIKNNWRIIDLAVQIHKSPSYVSKRIQLLEADPQIVAALQDEQISISIADELNKIDDPISRERLLFYAINSGATVETVRTWRIQYETDRLYIPPEDSQQQPQPTELSSDGEPKIYAHGDEPPADKKVNETISETRPCFGCLAAVDVKEIFTIYLCRKCKDTIFTVDDDSPKKENIQEGEQPNATKNNNDQGSGKN